MSPIHLYNTLSKRVEEFQPINHDRINVFVCGPTVYDFPHLGHAKNAIQFDFIIKYLRWRGYNVFYLQNITDIDDKIIQRAAERNISWKDLAREFEIIYLEDMKALHITAVNEYARATDHIDHIVQQVKTLMEKGFGYRISDGIYFEISRFGEYGKLSGRTDIQKEDAVSRVDESKEKRGWNDFCLWKVSKPGEPCWETEIGPGRPGWHIEDTAITETYFGPQYDIHGGGVDLIFPHHEAEIAQMEAASGKQPLVRYWLHIGFLNVNSQKMSKSLGNFKTIRDALASYDYRVLRYFFISSQYRSAIDYNELSLEQAKNALKRIDEFLFNIDQNYDDIENEKDVEILKSSIIECLDDDFNAPKALAVIFDFIRSQNAKGKMGIRIYNIFKEINQFFDVMTFAERNDIDEMVKRLIEERNEYRKQKLFAKADEIRSRLTEMGIELYDTKDGVKWRQAK